jgi:Ca2+-binding EF-hand superfamily protein
MPSGRSFVMSKINPSGHGGPLSWNDVAAAAKEKFADLDTDRDGQLDPNEATGVLTRKEFVAEDHDNDGVLDQTEFVIAVKTLFRSADIDRDGRLDKDLSTNQGVELVGLLAY